MKKYLACSLLLAFISAFSASAQLADKAEIQSVKEDYLGLNPASKPISLIDFSKLKWSQSYSISYFSGAGSSGTVGFYTSSIFYEFTPSLSIDVTLGIAHDPAALFNRNVQTNAALYPAVNLDYHPSENFRMSVGFVSHPGFYSNPYYPYRFNDWRRY
jgi:hypothetical protein